MHLCNVLMRANRKVHSKLMKGNLFQIAMVGAFLVLSPLKHRLIGQDNVAQSPDRYGIVETDTGTPLPEAHVRINGGQMAVSDQNGRFDFTHTEDGKILASATFPGYFQTPTTMEFAGDADEIRIVLVPGGTLTGVVRDADYLPIGGATVTALMPGFRSGVRYLTPLGGGSAAVTADDGSFQIPGLPAGDYVVSVELSRDKPVIGYTYYPGSSSADQAVLLRVIPGLNVGGVNIVVNPDPQTIHDVTFRFDGFPFPGSEFTRSFAVGEHPFRVSLRRVGWRYSEPPIEVALEQTSPGAYRIVGLRPGEYELILAGSSMSMTDTARIVRADFVVDEEEEDVDLGRLAAAGSRVWGRVQVRGAGLEDTGIFLRFAMVDAIPFQTASNVTVDRRTGAFEVTDVAPGIYEVLVGRTNQNLVVESMNAQSQDVMRNGLEVLGETFLDIVLTAESGALRGTLIDANGEPVVNGRIVVLPPATERGPMLRFPTAETDFAGRFDIGGIPVGEYTVVGISSDALPFLPSSSMIYYDPEFIEAYEPFGERISIDSAGRSMMIRAVD